MLVMALTLSPAEALRVSGDGEFVYETETALALLKARAPGGRGLIEKYIVEIRQADWVGVDPHDKVIGINKKMWLGVGGLEWYASVLAHETAHVVLYEAGLVWWGEQGEREANTYQAMVLERLVDEEWMAEWGWLIPWLGQVNWGENWPNYPREDFKVKTNPSSDAIMDYVKFIDP